MEMEINKVELVVDGMLIGVFKNEKEAEEFAKTRFPGKSFATYPLGTLIERYEDHDRLSE